MMKIPFPSKSSGNCHLIFQNVIHTCKILKRNPSQNQKPNLYMKKSKKNTIKKSNNESIHEKPRKKYRQIYGG